jgi:hypothetical protein
MPDKENAENADLAQVDHMDSGHLSNADLEIVAGGTSNDIKPPTLTEPGEPSDGSGGT